MALIITPVEIANATSTSPSASDVQVAQDIVELFAGRDLLEPLPEDRFTAADLRRLRLAVQWQTLYLLEHPEILTREMIKRASANGASVEREDDGILAPLAARCLNQVSWSAGGVQVATLRPSLPYVRRQPDPWVRVS